MTAGGDTSAPASPPPRRQRRIALGVALVLLALVAIVLRWASQPQQVADLVLAQTGRALGLEITAAGKPEYRLGPAPQIVLRDVISRRPGDPVPLLRAQRLLLSVPWTTLRSRGRDLAIHRIEMDRPQLDIAALQRWLATRPRVDKPRVPRLTDGLVVRAGTLHAEGWRLEGVDIDVPLLAPEQPLRGHLVGRLVAGGTRMPFDVFATLARPRQGAGLGMAGKVSLERPDWRMPMDVVVSGRPVLDGPIRLRGMRLGANATYVSRSTRLPFTFGLAGDATYRAGLQLEPLGVALRQGRELPDLTASGRVDWARVFSVHLDGRMLRWPARWPALSSPIGRPGGPLPMTLAYTGTLDLAGETSLVLRDGRTRFDGRFRLPALLAWIGAPPTTTPLPPIAGRVRTPRLDIPGATLHGVEIVVEP